MNVRSPCRSIVLSDPSEDIFRLRVRMIAPLRAYQMRVFEFFNDTYVVKLDIQVLIHALESSADRDVVLQFDRYLCVDQGLEEAMYSVSWKLGREVSAPHEWPRCLYGKDIPEE